ncbi:hypothetical protein HD553DRAFT_313181 [Filobasidium floriforme]|uniref:uncharacterized protein n=1 Tax=Filobasidium floriforme TaxID=5210 RepID=UPI001E8E1957|nr:uncharacterized protein HD553DRAFT_313181 [Filobasidium floriforme]KAH8083063.1 hypothetical protein HD553DRAFT_313181 [Filobasidium floriforme]
MALRPYATEMSGQITASLASAQTSARSKPYTTIGAISWTKRFEKRNKDRNAPGTDLSLWLSPAFWRIGKSITIARFNRDIWPLACSKSLNMVLTLRTDHDCRRDTIWTSISLAPHDIRLEQPRPTFTIGFNSPEPVKTGSIRQKRSRPRSEIVSSTAIRDYSDRDVIQEMIRQAGANSIPHVNQGHPELFYPFSCFQVEPNTSSARVAIDRPARSLSSAIGILQKLTIRAKDTFKLPVVVFGATSVGELWRLYVAYEPEPWHYGIVCNICTTWTGMIQEEDSCNSVERLWLMERIKRWSIEILRPQLQTWLGYSQPRAPKGVHA